MLFGNQIKKIESWKLFCWDNTIWNVWTHCCFLVPLSIQINFCSYRFFCVSMAGHTQIPLLHLDTNHAKKVLPYLREKLRKSVPFNRMKLMVVGLQVCWRFCSDNSNVYSLQKECFYTMHYSVWQKRENTQCREGCGLLWSRRACF